MATQDDFVRTALRVPPDLHARIHKVASASNRTFNAEIVARLAASFESKSKMSDHVSRSDFEKFSSDLLDQLKAVLDVTNLVHTPHTLPAVRTRRRGGVTNGSVK